MTLNGQTGATIQPINASSMAVDPESPYPVAAIVYVNGVSNVTISGLIIDGSQANLSALGCGQEFYGIYYSNSAGLITHNAVRFIELPPSLFGCQTGLAIFADNGSGASNNVTIQTNSVHDYQKNGITVDGAGLNTTVTGNTVAGIGPTALTAQNGIQISDGATGTVSSNNVSSLLYTLCPDIADCTYATTGILIYDSVGVIITGNTVEQTQGAIYAYSDATPPTLNNVITSNKVSNSQVFDGIAVYGDGSTISSNTIVNSSESGVNFLGNSNKASGNTVIEAPVGVLISFGTGSVINGEKNYDVPLPVVTAPPAAASIKAHQPRR